MKSIISLTLMLFLALPAYALQKFEFVYKQSENVVVNGVFTGRLQSDGNTIFVNSVVSTNYNETPFEAEYLFLYSTDRWFGGAQFSNIPIITIDGSTMKILACAESNCNRVMLIDTAGYFVDPFVEFGGYGALGIVIQGNFDSNNWSITRVTSVPESSTWLMMILGFMAIGSVSRIRNLRYSS